MGVPPVVQLPQDAISAAKTARIFTTTTTTDTTATTYAATTIIANCNFTTIRTIVVLTVNWPPMGVFDASAMSFLCPTDISTVAPTITVLPTTAAPIINFADTPAAAAPTITFLPTTAAPIISFADTPEAAAPTIIINIAATPQAAASNVFVSVTPTDAAANVFVAVSPTDAAVFFPSLQMESVCYPPMAQDILVVQKSQVEGSTRAPFFKNS